MRYDRGDVAREKMKSSLENFEEAVTFSLCSSSLQLDSLRERERERQKRGEHEKQRNDEERDRRRREGREGTSCDLTD